MKPQRIQPGADHAAATLSVQAWPLWAAKKNSWQQRCAQRSCFVLVGSLFLAEQAPEQRYHVQGRAEGVWHILDCTSCKPAHCYRAHHCGTTGWLQRCIPQCHDSQPTSCERVLPARPCLLSGTEKLCIEVCRHRGAVIDGLGCARDSDCLHALPGSLA